MFEENNAIAPEVNESTENSNDSQQTTSQNVSEGNSDFERNIAAMRRLKQKAERERDEAFRLLKEMQTQAPKVQEASNDISIADEDLVEGKHLKNYYQKLEKQQQEIRMTQQQYQQNLQETKLRAELHDIDKVVSSENVEILRESHPELFHTLSSNSDIYTKGKAAYLMIKQLGIYKEDLYSADRKRAHDNANKPRPLTSVSPQEGESPLSHANAFAGGLTDELKKQLHREMVEAMKNR